MKLFKIILVIFAVYFIRRFWQLYRIMEKRGKELRSEEEGLKPQENTTYGKVVDAEYKVIDR